LIFYLRENLNLLPLLLLLPLLVHQKLLEFICVSTIHPTQEESLTRKFNSNPPHFQVVVCIIMEPLFYNLNMNMLLFLQLSIPKSLTLSSCQ